MPVILPPGWLSLGARPTSIGSSPVAKTMGIVMVAALAACAAASPPAMIRGALTANEFGRQSRQSLVSTFRPAVFDRNVPSLNVTGFGQASAQRRYEVG